LNHNENPTQRAAYIIPILLRKLSGYLWEFENHSMHLSPKNSCQLIYLSDIVAGCLKWRAAVKWEKAIEIECDVT